MDVSFIVLESAFQLQNCYCFMRCQYENKSYKQDKNLLAFDTWHYNGGLGLNLANFDPRVGGGWGRKTINRLKVPPIFFHNKKTREREIEKKEEQRRKSDKNLRRELKFGIFLNYNSFYDIYLIENSNLLEIKLFLINVKFVKGFQTHDYA